MSDPQSDPHRSTAEHEESPEEGRSPGPNLILIYSLLALGLIVAIGLALLIVLPFYHRH
jgi:hypothetical protein